MAEGGTLARGMNAGAEGDKILSVDPSDVTSGGTPSPPTAARADPEEGPDRVADGEEREEGQGVERTCGGPELCGEREELV